MPRKLAAVRRQIDRLDLQLLRLLNLRAACALEIGRIKKRRKWPVFDGRREAFVLRQITRANRGPLSDAAVRSVFRAVLTQCRRRERKGRKR
jgi:chorismate mutase